MITVNQYKLSWDHFKDINQDKRMAFECLCRSLFIRTQCGEDVVVHSNPNNPGIEIEPVQAKSGNGWIGFQAKFFDGNVGQRQYKEIEKSMSAAVKYYAGKIDKIFLYCNKDISTKSKQYIKIQGMVKAANIEIVLVTGQSILDMAMNYPTILACYFGIDSLGRDWFYNNLKISLDNLGKRYNPKFNIDTKAQRKLSIFLREVDGIEILNNRKEEAINELKKVVYKCNDEYRKYISCFISSIEKLPDASMDDIQVSLSWKNIFLSENEDALSRIHTHEHELRKKIETVTFESSEYRALYEELRVLNSLLAVAEDLSLDKTEQQLLLNQVLVITGDMGTGKSQLLAAAAKRMLDSNMLSLLLLGQTFTSEQSIEVQILGSVERVNSNDSLEAIIAVMDENAYINSGLSVIFIDAINESRYREIWKIGINRLISIMAKYKNVRLVITVRNGFEELLLSDKVLEGIKNGAITQFEHCGLLDESPEGIFEFLTHFGIPASPDYYLRQEMGNPLFLTWFCQTFTGEDQGMVSLISSVLKKVDEEASREAGYANALGLLEVLLREFINKFDEAAISKEKILGLSAWDLYGVTNKIAYIKAVERAGVLSTYARDREEIYYIGYNLLEEYIRATCIIHRNKSKAALIDYCETELLKIGNDGIVNDFGKGAVFSMVAALYAINSGEECIEILDNMKEGWQKKRVIEEYIKILTWSNFKIPYERFIELARKYRIVPQTVWNIFIENATRVGCGINADGLTKLLMRYPLNKRDCFWTIHINGMTERDRIISLAYYIESGKEQIVMDEEKTALLLILYAWMLSSSNRVLRDRISKAMIEILRARFNLCVMLLDKFKEVNDPYIIQRLYGIVFGVVMKRKGVQTDEFKKLASFVFKEVFSKEKVYPDILLRDYARLIVERFIYEFPDKASEFDVCKFRPPYNSDPIPEVAIVNYSNKKYRGSGLGRLLLSMKFNTDVKGLGMYGDFGRYVFQTALEYFVDVDIHNVYYYAVQYIINDLGYSDELFGEYDTQMVDFDRGYVKKLERIGKKYEWITMYNILARLSDTHNVTASKWADKNGEPYNGPWNPYVRDFDPTLNCRCTFDRDDFPCLEGINVNDEDCFIAKEATLEEIDHWLCNDEKIFSDMGHRLIVRDDNGSEWVSLYTYSKKEKNVPRAAERFVSNSTRGEQRIWTLAAAYIVEGDEAVTLEKLWKLEFVKRRSSLARDCYNLYSREYAWSPAYKNEFSFNDEEEFSMKVSDAVINFLWEKQYDASQDDTTSFMIPAGSIIQEIGLYEKDIDGVYYYNDEIVAFDKKILDGGPRELFLRRDVLDAFLEKREGSLFWGVLGEKQFFIGEGKQRWKRREGYYLYDKDFIKGEMRIVPEP